MNPLTIQEYEKTNIAPETDMQNSVAPVVPPTEAITNPQASIEGNTVRPLSQPDAPDLIHFAEEVKRRSDPALCAAGTEEPPNASGAPADECVVCRTDATHYSPQGLPYCEAHLPATLYRDTPWFNPASEEAVHLQALRWACMKDSRVAAWDTAILITAFGTNGRVGTAVWNDGRGQSAPLLAKGFIKEVRKAYWNGNDLAVRKLAKYAGANMRLLW